MEGYLESFIYLLITIVILVLSMRKKKPVQVENEENEQTGDPFRELFKDEEDEEYEDRAQPSLAEGRESPDKAPAVSWMSDKEAQNMVIDADKVLKEAAENNPIARLEGKVEDDAYYISQSDENDIPFDLKKAVIYSEILQRRTF